MIINVNRSTENKMVCFENLFLKYVLVVVIWAWMRDKLVEVDVFCRAVKSQPWSELQGSRWHDQPDMWVSLWKGAPPPKAAALYQLCFFWLMIIFLHIQRTMLLPMHDVIKHQQQLLHSLSPYCVQNLISQEELLVYFSHVHVKTWISLWFISGCSVINLIVIWWSYLQVQKNTERATTFDSVANWSNYGSGILCLIPGYKQNKSRHLFSAPAAWKDASVWEIQRTHCHITCFLPLFLLGYFFVSMIDVILKSTDPSSLITLLPRVCLQRILATIHPT